MKLVIYYCSQCEMMNLNGDTRIDAHVSGSHVPEVDGHRLVRVESLHSLIPDVNRHWAGKTDGDAVMYEHHHKTQIRILLEALAILFIVYLFSPKCRTTHCVIINILSNCEISREDLTLDCEIRSNKININQKYNII